MASDVPPPPPPAPSEGSAAPQESKRMMAGILAIVLGGFGVHKFVLGMTTPGLILVGTMVACIIVAVVTCGIGSFLVVIPGIIGLVEGIIYLTKSDEEFIRLYQGPNKKQWF